MLEIELGETLAEGMLRTRAQGARDMAGIYVSVSEARTDLLNRVVFKRS